MKREFMITADGSSTIHLPDWNEQYHSKNGALQEAYHVFIEAGLYKIAETVKNIAVLEIGFGTGLNAFITFLESDRFGLNIDYIGIEAYPVCEDELENLNYVTLLNAESKKNVFKKMHTVDWNEKQSISTHFSLTKRKQFFEDITDENSYNLIYFDAFGAKNQPDLWTEVIFEKMYKAIKNNGVLVTYAAKGSVRRAMQTVGFTVERLPGPAGKREMLRATKTI